MSCGPEAPLHRPSPMGRLRVPLKGGVTRNRPKRLGESACPRMPQAVPQVEGFWARGPPETAFPDSGGRGRLSIREEAPGLVRAGRPRSRVGPPPITLAPRGDARRLAGRRQSFQVRRAHRDALQDEVLNAGHLGENPQVGGLDAHQLGSLQPVLRQWRAAYREQEIE